MSTARGSPATPLEHEVISPELALVDPVLGASARASALEPRPQSRSSVVVPVLRETVPAVGYRPPGGVSSASSAPSPARGSWRGYGAVVAVTVLGLLLFDLRTEIGRGPTEADPPREAVAAAPGAPQTTPKPDPKLGPNAAPPRTQKRSTSSAPAPETRRLAWAPTPGASGYHIELFRSNTRVFAGTTEQPQITIPRTWRLQGHRHALRPGSYRWIVWPVVDGRRVPSATVQATLSIPR